MAKPTKKGVRHYLTDDNRGWASPLIRETSKGALDLRVTKRKFGAFSGTRRSKREQTGRKELWLGILEALVGEDYDAQRRAVEASIRSKFLSSKEWTNVLYVGEVHAKSKLLMPWDGLTPEETRNLLRGPEGVEAARAKLAENRPPITASKKHLDDYDSISREVGILYRVVSRWLRSGRKLMDVSLKSQELLQNLWGQPDEAITGEKVIRWGALPKPGDELWKRGVFFRFEPARTDFPVSPWEFITFAQSVGDVFAEDVNLYGWWRHVGAPFANDVTAQLVDRNQHVMARRNVRKTAIALGRPEDSPLGIINAGRHRGFRGSGYWSPAFEFEGLKRGNAFRGEGPGYNVLSLTEADKKNERMVLQQQVAVQTLNLLAALNNAYKFQTHQKPRQKVSKSSPSVSRPERIELTEDGLATWVQEIIRDETGMTSRSTTKRWKQGAHVRCETTALVRVKAENLKPHEVVVRKESRTLKSGEVRLYYWVRRYRAEAKVEGEVRGKNAHVVAGKGAE
jgi:hypothetical protein